MSTPHSDISSQRAKVQRLADQVHAAKVKIDRMLWGPGGLPTDSEALARCLSTVRRARGPEDVARNINDAFLHDYNYRRLKAQWILAKTELDCMSRTQEVPDRVKATREMLKKKFESDLTNKVNASLSGSGPAYFSEDLELQKKIEETVNEAVKKVRAERAVGSVASLTETIGMAMTLGYDDTKSDLALKNAALVAKNIASTAAELSRSHPENKLFKANVVRAEALSQALGNETANQDIIFR